MVKGKGVKVEERGGKWKIERGEAEELKKDLELLKSESYYSKVNRMTEHLLMKFAYYERLGLGSIEIIINTE